MGELSAKRKHLAFTPGVCVCSLEMLAADTTAVSTSTVVELAAQGSLQT